MGEVTGPLHLMRCFSKGLLAVSCVCRVFPTPGTQDLLKVKDRMVWTPGGASGRPEQNMRKSPKLQPQHPTRTGSSRSQCPSVNAERARPPGKLLIKGKV